MNPSPRLHLALVTAAALTLAAVGTRAGVIAFDAISAGGFTAVGIPPADVTVHIDHSLVVATPFSFAKMVADEKVIFTTLPPSVIDGVFTFEDFGGNTLGGTFTGVLLDTSNPTVKLVQGPFDFTGGTGPYTGATGSGQLDAQIQFLDPTGALGISGIVWKGELALVPEPQTAGLVTGLALFGLAIWRRRNAGTC